MTNATGPIACATLLVGTPERVREEALSVIKRALCKDQGCTTCATCQLATPPGHHMVWICPEKKYTLDLLEPIEHKILFSLDVGDRFFFVLEKADFLTPATANSLLKVVEEPPYGYHFLFLAQQAQLVIPTIRSRCHVRYLDATKKTISRGFLRHFLETSSSPSLFLKELQTDCPEDYETPECLDILLAHWSQEHVKQLVAENKAEADRARRMISLLQDITPYAPMPGSAKLFWRDLFLRKGVVNL